MTIFIDFEFNQVNEEKVKLVCCCLYNDISGETKDFWLHKDDKSHKRLVKYLEDNKLETFAAYSTVAECRSFISLDLNPTGFNWVDLFLEWRCLTNHNNQLIVGNHYMNGKIIYIPEPKNKWERTSEEVGHKLKHSLAECTYRLTGEIRDVKHKEDMRDLIISCPESFSDKERADILEYCKEDVTNLPAIFKRIKEEYKKILRPSDFELLLSEMLYRGKYAALTSIRESKGYPIQYEKILNLSSNIPFILDECMREINSLFPQIKPFKWCRKDSKYTWDQIATKKWIEENHKDWARTEKEKTSLALESWENKYHYRHEYPKDNFGAQMLRYLKIKQSLSGFLSGKGGKSFFDSVGSDKRVRPYMNIYGAQSGRSQPASSSFLFLKPAWCRSLMQPSPGKAIVSIDYGSEEFFLSALMSKDKNMIGSYLAGDVYLEFAKLSKMVPKDATKSTHKYERNLAKATVLGLSYRMSKYGLANKLSQDMGRVITTGEAQELIDKFYEVYETFKEWQDNLIYDYAEKNIPYIKLPDGWIMFGDNPNARSVGNVPVQGMGSCVMRRADLLCHERGLYSPFTLHDALYIEIDSKDLKAIDTFIECMVEGFVYFFPDQKEVASKIRLDVYAWSEDYEEDSFLLTPKGNKIECSNSYIDERSIKEHNQFSKYFSVDGSMQFL